MPLFEPFCGVRPCVPVGDDVLSFCETTIPSLLRASKEEQPAQCQALLETGICAQDSHPAFYLYEEKLTLDDGAEKCALGFFALSTASVTADPFRPAILLDRDPTGQTFARLQALSQGAPRYEAYRGNRRYRLWLIDDLVVQAALRGEEVACVMPPTWPRVFSLIFPGEKPDFPLCPLIGMVFADP